MDLNKIRLGIFKSIKYMQKNWKNKTNVSRKKLE